MTPHRTVLIAIVATGLAAAAALTGHPRPALAIATIAAAAALAVLRHLVALEESK